VAAFSGSTSGSRQPGTHDHVHGNSISHCVPHPHAGGLVLHFLPVPRKDKEGRDQSHAQADQDAGPGPEAPGGLIPNHVNRNAIDPAQDHAQENANEHLYLGIGILLLRDQSEANGIIETE